MGATAGLGRRPDRPRRQPARKWKPGKRTTRRAIDLVEDAEFVRQHGGYGGASIGQIAMRLGVSRDCLEQAHARARRYAARTTDQGPKESVIGRIYAGIQAARIYDAV